MKSFLMVVHPKRHLPWKNNFAVFTIVGKNQKTHLPQTEKKTRTRTQKNRKQNTARSHQKKKTKQENSWRPSIFGGNESFERRAIIKKLYKNPNENGNKNFKNICINYSITKTITRNIDTVFRNEELKDLRTSSGTKVTSSFSFMHTATILVETSIQSLKRLLLANLKDGLNPKSASCTVWVIRFTTKTTGKHLRLEKNCKKTDVTYNSFAT